ncbi:hypothetical protein J6590_061336 [Homalodisca vitripennis]|nr:hypothetical protein J6590_061336 [Homalodisca vitripennis]
METDSGSKAIIRGKGQEENLSAPCNDTRESYVSSRACQAYLNLYQKTCRLSSKKMLNGLLKSLELKNLGNLNVCQILPLPAVTIRGWKRASLPISQNDMLRLCPLSSLMEAVPRDLCRQLQPPPPPHLPILNVTLVARLLLRGTVTTNRKLAT